MITIQYADELQKHYDTRAEAVQAINRLLMIGRSTHRLLGYAIEEQPLNEHTSLFVVVENGRATRTSNNAGSGSREKVVEWNEEL